MSKNNFLSKMLLLDSTNVVFGKNIIKNTLHSNSFWVKVVIDKNKYPELKQRGFCDKKLILKQKNKKILQNAYDIGFFLN